MVEAVSGKQMSVGRPYFDSMVIPIGAALLFVLGVGPALPWGRASAEHTAGLDFDGYGIGGLSVGETRTEMLPALAAALEPLPADRPRYLMGVGDPASMVEAIDLGVDQFDCVLQTRLGRHGTALTSAGKVQVKAARQGAEDLPVDASCACAVCARHSRGYLRHLFSVAEPSASRLLTLHNIAWTLQLMTAAREAIEAHRFAKFKEDVLRVWG